MVKSFWAGESLGGLWNIRYPSETHLNTLGPRQNGPHFPDDIFKCIFLNENAWISIKISLKFVPKGPINKNPALVQIMAWRRSGDKPLSEPMMVSLLTHICVTRPQWVKPKPCEILFAHNLFLIYTIILKFCTEHSSITVVLCTKFQNNLRRLVTKQIPTLCSTYSSGCLLHMSIQNILI